MSPPRVALVGTDTAVGKTTLACALLRQAGSTRVLPFKPTQSGAPGESDAARLLDASRWRELAIDEICPLRYDVPLAPGIADDRTRFVAPRPADVAPLHRCTAALEHAITRAQPELVIIELAGGLWVPMPGGTWQPQWLRALATHTIVVGRAGLGAINAALCTIDALRGLDLAPIAFVLCETTAPDPSCRDNAAVIACARGLPHLGTLPHDAAAPELLRPLRALL